MTVRILLAALAAGLFAGILMTPVQYRQVVPILLQAETFEGATHFHEDTTKTGEVHGENAMAPGALEPSPRRFRNTVMANLVTGAGFALLMLGVSLISGVRVRPSSGLAWGAAGWLAVQFMPAIGLPPELPGFPYVDLTTRQYWWTATVAASVIGMSLLFLSKQNMARLVGIALLIAPHVYGAPQPSDITSHVPAYLAAQFVMAALATTLFFWLALGLLLGFFMDRYGEPA